MTKKILIGIGILLSVLLVIDTIVVFTPKTATFGASSNINSINLVPNTTVGGDTYALAVNGATVIGTSGLFSGIVQSASTVNIMGTVLSVNVIEGYGSPVTSSTVSQAPTAAQICQGSVGTYTQLGSSSAMTYTFPAATTTYASCANGLVIDGTVNQSNFIHNSGTAAITIATSTGDTLYMNGSSTNSLGAGQTWEITGQFVNSSTWALYATQYLPK